MNRSSGCPERAVLRDYAIGRTSEEAAAVLDRHLAECAACRQNLPDAVEEDEFVAAFRCQARQPVPRNALLEALRGKLYAVVASANSSEPGTASEESAATATPCDQGPADPEGWRALLAPAQQLDEIGRLGPYRVLKLIGAGGMGVVFQAEDPQLRRLVALKSMRPGLAASPAACQRFLREARLTGALMHDHIVPIYHVGEERGTPFLAMPLLSGETLAERLGREEHLPIDEVLRIGRELAEGLAHAHERGLIHRDIKPANIWLEAPSGRVKILDFGLARSCQEETHLTQSGLIMGTPSYMAPEQANLGTVDARSDLFSLGCVLYRLSTGEVPFKGSTVMAVLAALTNDQPRPVDDINPEIPADLSSLVMRLLAKDPAARPASAREVIQEIKAIENRRFQAAREQPAADPVPEPAARAGKRRRWVATVAAGLMAMAALVAGIVLTINTGKGTVVIETDSDVEVLVRRGGEEIVILDRKSNQQATLDAGTYTVELKKGDRDTLTLETKEFTLRRGKEVIVRVTRKAAPNSGTSPPERSSPIGPPPSTSARAGNTLDNLDPAQIPAEERFDWQPKELVAVIGTHARRMWGACSDVQISPDGKLVAVGAEAPAMVVVFDMATRQPRWIIPRIPYEHIQSVRFTPDSKRLIVGRHTNGVLIAGYDLTGEKPTPIGLGTRKRYEGPIWGAGTTAEVLEGGRTIAGMMNWRSPVFMDVSGEKPVQVGERLATGPVAFAAPANVIVYHTPEKKLRIATVRNARLVGDVELPIEWNGEGAISLSADGRRLVVFAKDEFQVWDVSQQPAQLRHRLSAFNGTQFNSSCGASLSPDGRWLICGAADAMLFRIDGDKPKAVGSLQLYSQGSFAFSPDGNTLVVANIRGLVRWWNLSGTVPKELSPFAPGTAIEHEYNCPRFAARGGELLLNRFDQRYQLWDLTGARPRPSPKAGITFTAWPGSASAGPKNQWIIRLWDGTEKEPLQLVGVQDGRWERIGPRFGENRLFSRAIEVRSDGREMVSLTGAIEKGQWKSFRMEGWDLAACPPQQRWNLPIPNKENTTVFWSGGGSLLAALVWRAKEEGPVDLKLWRWGESKPTEAMTIPVGISPRSYRIALSPDGRYLAHLKEKETEIVVTDVTGPGPREVTTISPGSSVLSLAFGPEGRLAWSGMYGAGVWDIVGRKPLWTWKTAPGAVHTVQFSPDGRHLFTHNANHTVYVIRLSGMETRK
jgi:WD40 repeat protein